MSKQEGSGWSRREFGGAAALLALALGIPIAGVMLSDFDESEAPTERQSELLREVAQLVIPRTDTPGAGDVGTGAFVALALAHGLDGTRRPAASSEMPWSIPEYQRPDGSLKYISWLEGALDRKANGDWLRRNDTERKEILSALDAQAYAEGADAHPWRKLKGLILTGYYTSEAGGSQELLYEPVPGRFDPRVPQREDTRAYSNDWTAVEFG